MPTVRDETPEVSRLSTEYLKVPFTSNVDPDTIAGVDIAFTADHGTEPTTWHPATIADGAARILLGPDGGIEPGVGLWWVWVRLTDSPETTVEIAGLVEVY